MAKGQYGISIQMRTQFSSTFGAQSPDTVLQRAAQSSGGSTAPSTTWETIAVLPNDINNFYDDITGSQSIRYFYRCRHQQTGTAASTWLGTVDAKPTILQPGV